MKSLWLALLLSSTALADTPPPANTDHLKEGVVNLYSTSDRIDARITLQKGAANGLAVLDGSGKVPSAQLPPSSGGTWGSITGTLSSQTDLQSALNAKEPTITGGTTSQYWRGDKTFHLLDTSVVPENGSLYWTQGRFDTAFGGKSTSNLSEGSNLYYTDARSRAAISATTPLSYNNGTGVLSIPQANSAQAGFLTAADWTTFNNKLDRSQFNYITNPDADTDTAGWNLYDNSGNTVAASIVDQDITYTSLASGDAGNGQTVSYQLGTSPYAEPPVITCPTGNSVLVKWYNGPTIAQNPTATVLKAAWDASCAASMATATITGTASNRQYMNGTVTLGNGGDASPVDGTGGSVTGVTITRNTSAPLGGVADLDLGKDANSRYGMGVSTDFTIQSLDKGVPLQLSFTYSGSAAMTLGTSSDVRIFIYDVTNAALIPITPLKTLAGPVSTTKTFVGKFTASGTSVNYRLILHIATQNASAWDLRMHNVVISDVLNAEAATQVPSVVLQSQPINGSVTDHMVVVWTDGASAWVPATTSNAANPSFGTDRPALGFATNIVGLTADIYVHGFMDGFSFGPFVGYNQYIDTTAGGISPLPSPFTDTYVPVGKAVSSTALNIDFKPHVDLVQTSGVPRKGGILTNTGANDGTGDVAIAGGTTGQFLRANSGITNGLQWFTPVGTAPIVYTASTSAFSCTTATNSVAGCMSAADHALLHNAVTIGTANGLSLSTQVLSLAAATTSVTGALTSTDWNTFNNKAPTASPTFTGDVNASTGNVLISTIGKGLQVKTGTNAKIGTATLVGGTATVSNTSVTANSRIFLTSNTDGGTPGWLRVSAKTNGTSFVITSSSVLDTSTVAWMIVESIP